jgi:hypothetical protein
LVEETMPGRRPDKKGSFGGHFDELVRVFEPEPVGKRDRPEREKPKADENVHDRLFESAWRKTPEH